ncbi:PD-(D/E)XK nuclease family protein, partial [Parabacteroides sp. OttesenSCG-928-G21]|nr:PD-(D/E)XK nuclease family protein [Parabacteroides sp. OttesenSCG-928-G21]
YDKVVFVGFNALSTAEEQLLLLLRDKGLADFYWDYTSSFVTDPQNRASYFSTHNLKLFPSSFSLPKEEDRADKKITITGVSSGTGQAKHVHELLKELLQNGEINEEDSLRTAIVLPDEHLLIPLLHSIPEEIGHVNVTMGYPLSNTPIAALMDYVLALQKNTRMAEGKQTFYFRDVLPILNHPYISSESPEVIAKLVKEITSRNKIYVNEDFLHVTPLLKTVFKMVNSVDDCMSYLVSILENFNRLIAAGNTDVDSETELPASSQDIQQEFIFYYYTTVNRIKELIQEAEIEMKIDTCFRLIKRATDLITIPFEGEPLSGLQIMGVLETRTLDFDRVIILSVNEGVFPSGRSSASFIPYNLRRGFGLPTYEHQDSVWAYHFYRLIHRAKDVNLLYDTRSGGLLSGEMSRYIYQLQYHYELPVQNKLAVYNVSSSKINTYEVAKTEDIMQKLSAYCTGGSKALSASVLNVYLDCPLMFYFSAIEGVKEVDEVSETIENDVFGSILHKVMEDLYRPLQGQLLTADILKILQKDKKAMTEIIRNAFAEEFYKDMKGPLIGQNYLVSEMIRKYALKIIEQDAKLTPFRYLESERKVFTDFTLTNGTNIQLKGFIDRMDEVNDSLRIIDYKSGSGTAAFQTIPGLFDKADKDRPKAVMQVFLYAWMVMQQEDFKQINQLVYPGIYYLRSLFSADFSAHIKQKIERNYHIIVDDFSRYTEEFESHLRTDCLDELFNPEVPFFQTPTGKACTYCQFKSICGK